MPKAQSCKRNSIKNNNINRVTDKDRYGDRHSKKNMRRTKQILIGGGRKNKGSSETPKTKKYGLFSSFLKRRKDTAPPGPEQQRMSEQQRSNLNKLLRSQTHIVNSKAIYLAQRAPTKSNKRFRKEFLTPAAIKRQNNSFSELKANLAINAHRFMIQKTTENNIARLELQKTGETNYTQKTNINSTINALKNKLVSLKNTKSITKPTQYELYTKVHGNLLQATGKLVNTQRLASTIKLLYQRKNNLMKNEKETGTVEQNIAQAGDKLAAMIAAHTQKSHKIGGINPYVSSTA